MPKMSYSSRNGLSARVRKNKFIEPTSTNLENKTNKIIKHYKKNKQDKKAERALIITKAKLKKIKDYLDKKKSKNDFKSN